MVARQPIQRNAPGARLLVLLRQPADRAYSHFLYHRRLGIEPQTNFAAALADEPNRLRQPWPLSFCYRRMSHYVANLQNYLRHFPREQLRIYLYEEFVARPQFLLQEIFTFLGVDVTFAPDMSVRYNTARLPRSAWLMTFLRHPHWLKAWLGPFLPATWRHRLVQQLQRYNWKKPSPLAPTINLQ